MKEYKTILIITGICLWLMSIQGISVYAVEDAGNTHIINIEEAVVFNGGYSMLAVHTNPLNDISYFGRDVGKKLLEGREVFRGVIDPDDFTGTCEVEFTEDKRNPLQSTVPHDAIKVLVLSLKVGYDNARWLVDNYDIYISGKRYRLLLPDPYDPDYPQETIQDTVYAVIDDLDCGDRNYIRLIPKRGISERARFLGLGSGRWFLRMRWDVGE